MQNTKSGSLGLTSVAFAIADICVMDLKITIIKGRIFRIAKQLLSANPPASRERIQAFRDWFRINDWRGKRGDDPTPENICECWAKANQSLESWEEQDRRDRQKYVTGKFAAFFEH
jgi:hypothetical protein